MDDAWMTPCRTVNARILALTKRKIAKLLDAEHDDDDDDDEVDWMLESDDTENSTSSSSEDDDKNDSAIATEKGANVDENIEPTPELTEEERAAATEEFLAFLNPSSLAEAAADGFMGSLHRCVLLTNMFSRSLIFESMMDSLHQECDARWDVADQKFASQFPLLANEARFLLGQQDGLKSILDLYSDDDDDDSDSDAASILQDGFFKASHLSGQQIKFYRLPDMRAVRLYPSMTGRVSLVNDDEDDADSDISVPRRSPKRRLST